MKQDKPLYIIDHRGYAILIYKGYVKIGNRTYKTVKEAKAEIDKWY